MHLAEYTRCDGLELAKRVRRGEVTAAETAALARDGFRRVDGRIGAVTEFYEDRVTDVPPAPRGSPFCGVPVFLKDLGAAEAGRRQEMGSRLARGRIAAEDAYLAVRLRQSGALILGRTATPEFGLAATTESILCGTTRKPWNPDRMAGGSSGGAAAAVAAGIVPVAHASDGGGSIRIPAACCGVVGLKPSRGRVTCGPGAGERLFGLSQEFVVSRSVRDTAAMLDVLGRPAPGDPCTIVQPRRPYLREVGAPLKKLRIAVATESWTGVRAEPLVAEKVLQTARMCEDMGHRVSEARPHFELEPYYAALEVLWGASIASACDQVARRMNRPVDADHLEPVTLQLYRQGQHFSAADVIRAGATLNTVRRRVAMFFEAYDLLMTPTIARLPAAIGTLHLNRQTSLETWYRETAPYNAFTNLFNATGQPAVSLPLHQAPEGLPVGIQFAAAFGREALLIRLAAVLEEALPWDRRRPAVHVGR